MSQLPLPTPAPSPRHQRLFEHMRQQEAQRRGPTLADLPAAQARHWVDMAHASLGMAPDRRLAQRLRAPHPAPLLKRFIR